MPGNSITRSPRPEPGVQDEAGGPDGTWSIEVAQRTGSDGAFITLPADLLAALGWEDGAALVWQVDGDSKVTVLLRRQA